MKYKNLEVTKYLHDGFRIDWEGDPSFRLDEMQSGKFPQTIYIDPYKLPDGQPLADAIFITHDHGDHCDPESIQKILQNHTVIYGNKAVKEKIAELAYGEFREAIVYDPAGVGGVGGMTVTPLPAFNTNKFREPGNVFHPREAGGVGYLLTFNIHDKENTVNVYHMGDTDFIADEQRPAQVDILMIPVSGTYVMTAEEAIIACNTINPKIAIPMHFDSGIVGSLADAERFQTEVKCKVEILPVQQ